MSKELYVSDFAGVKKGHANLSFVDVNTNSDQQLFIDPNLIEISSDSWCQEANQYVNSFFDRFYIAYRSGDETLKKLLLSHSGEVNDTRLGYGGGNNGHGNTENGLLDKFKCLDSIASGISTISRAADLPVVIHNFDKDGLSDMLTNILRMPLYQFTVEQMKGFGIKPNAKSSFYYWDVEENHWVLKKDVDVYSIGKGPILLVPKHIVQKNYLYGPEHMFGHIILERIQREKAYITSRGKLKYPPKKELREKIKRQSSSEIRDYLIDFAEKTPDVFSEYHRRTYEFCSGRIMSDEELDYAVYGRKKI